MKIVVGDKWRLFSGCDLVAGVKSEVGEVGEVVREQSRAKVGKVEEGRRASDEGGKRKLAGCRCGNATLCPGKLTCCGQRCPCYVDNLACTDCKCKGCRNPHRWLAKFQRSSIKSLFQAWRWQGATYPALQ